MVRSLFNTGCTKGACILLLLTATAAATLAGCASFNSNSLPVNLVDNTNNWVQYKGNGAAAGAMLVGAMGPMGVAVGIAIDEGIEKEINETAQAGGFNAQVIVQQWLKEQRAQNSDFATAIKNCAAPEVILNKINLSNVTGGSAGEQLVTIDAKILVTAPNCKLYVRSINEASHKPGLVTAELDQLKTNGNTLMALFERWLNGAELVSNN